MQFKKILRLIKIVEESQIDKLEISGWGQRVRITKDDSQSKLFTRLPDAPQIPQWWESNSPSSLVSSKAQDQILKREEEDRGGIEIRSPMIGIFYHAAAPDQPPYVEVGDLIAPGQAICLIEAMKMMNEIQAEVGGRVVEVAVENGHPVEYNQVLFRVHKQ